MENKNAKPKSIGGVSFNDEQSNVYQQPLNQGQNNQKTVQKESNKWTVMCIILAILIVILLIVFVIVLVKKNDTSDDKEQDKTTAITSEEDNELEEVDKPDSTTEEVDKPDSTTEEVLTEEIIEAETDLAYEYIAPTELSGNWQDFQVSINDVYYQFPFPYYVLEENGWKADYEPEEIASAGTEWLMCKSPVSGYYFYFFVFNPQSTVQPLENCMVTGFTVDSGCSEDSIKFSDDLVFLSSVKDDFLMEFGAPEFVYDDDDGSERVNYETDDYEGYISLVFDENKVCVGVDMENQKMPEGFEQQMEISAEAPDINSEYEAPSGPAKDGLDPVVTIDGVDYKLPCPVSEFTKNGWQIESMSEEYIYAESFTISAFEKDGEKFFCEIYNFTSDTIFTYNGMVTMIDVEEGYLDKVDVVFPGNLQVGDSVADFEAEYSDLESYDKDPDDDGDISYYLYEPIDDGYIYLSVYCEDATEGKITSYSFCYEK